MTGGQTGLSADSTVHLPIHRKPVTQHSTILFGTGDFAAATVTFTVNSSWTGYLPPAAGGGCNLDDAPIFTVYSRTQWAA